MDPLPGSGGFAVDADQRVAAETHLGELAGAHDPVALELGPRIYAVVCPEAADAYEGRLVETEEAHTLVPDGSVRFHRRTWTEPPPATRRPATWGGQARHRVLRRSQIDLLDHRDGLARAHGRPG